MSRQDTAHQWSYETLSVLGRRLLQYFSDSLTSKNRSFKLVNTCTALNASEVSSVFAEEAVGRSVLYACSC